VIEISDTSLSDNLGKSACNTKTWVFLSIGALMSRKSRFLHSHLHRMAQFAAFPLAPDGTIRRIRESVILPGLKLDILEQAL
jgi:hypothetical protein